jgi:uncharacterized phage-associated protein
MEKRKLMSGHPQLKAIDVADYILKRAGSMTAMKLQKLVYYSQVWSLVWTERELFRERIEAWANGPVVPSLYRLHRGHFKVRPGFFGGDPTKLGDEQRDVINRVLSFYGEKDPQWLSNLSHLELPWKQARSGMKVGERGSNVISKESIIEYYSSL